MNDIFETDGALRAEFSEIENKKLNKIKADAIREAVYKLALGGLGTDKTLLEYADELEQSE